MVRINRIFSKDGSVIAEAEKYVKKEKLENLKTEEKNNILLWQQKSRWFVEEWKR